MNEKKLTLEDLDQSGAVMFLGGRIVGKQMFLRIMAEMRQYKTIEKENQIDIPKAIEICKKANTQKVIYQKENYGISSFAILDDLDVEILNHRLYVNARGMYVSLDLLEYGKTWALTKEELL